MKKFNNVIDQINEVLRQQWTLQALRRKAECTGHPAEVQQQITSASSVPAAATCSPPDLPRILWQGCTGTKQPSPTAPAERRARKPERKRKGVFAI